jgi:hypothetical protein
VRPFASLQPKKKPIEIRKLGGLIRRDRVRSLCAANRCLALRSGWVICLLRTCRSVIVSCRPGAGSHAKSRRWRVCLAQWLVKDAACLLSNACPDNIYAPGHVIVDSSVHAHPPALRLHIRPGVGDKIARRSVLRKQQAHGSAIGYCSSTRVLESRHAAFARSRRGRGSRGVYKRHRK